MVTPVVTPTYTDKPHLLADFLEMVIQWSTGVSPWQLTFSITDDHGETTSFTESYTPIPTGTEGVDKITVYDICELLSPYFDLSDHPGLVGFDTLGLKSQDNTRRATLNLTLHALNDHNLGSRYFVYSNAPSGIPHTGTDATGGIGSRFLSRCDLLAVASGHPCAVSWFGHGETLKVKLLHYVNGIPQLTEVAALTAEDSNNMQTYNFTLTALAEAANIDVKDVIYADAQLFLNSALQDSVRFMHDSRHRAHERVFAFIGAMGEPEFFAMTGTENREAEYEGVFLMEHNDYRKADTSLRRIHTSYTGPLNEGERDTIWDMAASPWVYVIENGQLREVTITEVELTDSSPHREPIGYNVKWRYTNELVQRTFSRLPNVEEVEVISNDDTIIGLE